MASWLAARSAKPGDVDSDADLTNSYGTTEVSGIAGDLELRTSSGDIVVRDVAGKAVVEGSYGSMSVERVGAGAQISNSSGAVTLLDVGGDSSVRNSYAPVRVSGIRGSLRIDSSSSSVTVHGVDGTVNVQTSYDGVVVEDVGGSVNVRNQSGRVEVSGLRGEALRSPHTVETSYANIRFRWPASAPMQFEAQSSYGRIDSDFDGDRREASSQQSMAGGSSGPRIRLICSSGSVSLRNQ